jgi:uncharacterized delta-60 repeat protein
MNVVLLSSVLVALVAGTAAAQSEPPYATPDEAFNQKAYMNALDSGGSVKGLALQRDGKVLAIGSFPGGLRRFLADGSHDLAFDARVPAAKLHQKALAVVQQSDGKILVGGWFDGALRRLNADGSLDAAFNAAVTANVPSAVTTLGLQKNGAIIVGSYDAGKNLMRLDSSGTLDIQFTTNANAALDERPDQWGFGTEINSVVVQPNGKILVAGSFGQKLMRLNTDGTPDTAFTANLGAPFNYAINDITLQRDGKIIVAGEFEGLVRRVNADGTLDASFNAKVGRKLELAGYSDSGANEAVVQANGSILITGYFLLGLYAVVELQADGSVSKSFISTPLVQKPCVLTMVLQRNSNIVVGGCFHGWMGRYYGVNAGR